MKRVNIVLYQPEIPQNTGNIMRSCVGFNAKLHLIKPLGFKLDEKHLQRSCVDYFEHLDYEVYENYEEFLEKNPVGETFYLTRYGHKSPAEIDFKAIDKDLPIYIMFGRESTGIPYDLLHKKIDHCFRIPTTDKIRSLNLSNCASIMLFEVTSKLDEDPELIKHEPDCFKGENFIDNYTEK